MAISHDLYGFLYMNRNLFIFGIVLTRLVILQFNNIFKILDNIKIRANIELNLILLLEACLRKLISIRKRVCSENLVMRDLFNRVLSELWTKLKLKFITIAILHSNPR